MSSANYAQLLKTLCLAAVEAVLEGRQFLSGGLSGDNLTDTSSRPLADY
jgi:hypothetical protein